MNNLNEFQIKTEIEDDYIYSIIPDQIDTEAVDNYNSQECDVKSEIIHDEEQDPNCNASQFSYKIKLENDSSSSERCLNNEDNVDVEIPRASRKKRQSNIAIDVDYEDETDQSEDELERPTKKLRKNSKDKRKARKPKLTSKAKPDKVEKQWHYCDQCNYFTDKNNSIKHHRATHSDEKPFKCDICQRAFKLKLYLTSHKKVHERPNPNT